MELISGCLQVLSDLLCRLGYTFGSYILLCKLFSSPVITVTPYAKVEGDDITLTCETSLNPYRQNEDLQFAFFRDKTNIQDFRSSNKYKLLSARLDNSGSYFCEVRTSTNNVRKRSHELPFLIKELFSTPGINVTPDPAVEGDDITLTCDKYLSLDRKNTELQFAFYSDEENVQKFSLSNKYELLSAQLENTGSYYCVVKTSTNNIRKRSHDLSVLIKEFFSFLVINITQDSVVEGDEISLYFDTSLSRERRNSELQFALYKDGEKAQGFELSNKYDVLSAHVEDSGIYYCEVKASTNDMRKRSHDFAVLIKSGKKNHKEQNLIRLILSVCLLIGLFIIIIFHAKSQV
ncbi:Fc receptor-like protein 2 [Phyllobates terribilis]|uniref:Fc receptor-like protein 2 n=1 Tax=Phyllobates terribilis TaxID=111132 RepID=UPI003CCAF954